MSVILGIEKLKNQLDEEQINLLEQAAETHKQQSNITFCILVVEADSIQIETS